MSCGNSANLLASSNEILSKIVRELDEESMSFSTTFTVSFQNSRPSAKELHLNIFGNPESRDSGHHFQYGREFLNKYDTVIISTSVQNEWSAGSTSYSESSP